MSVNRKAVVIYGSTDLWIYWDKADKLRLFYRDISHNLCAKQVIAYRVEALLRYFYRVDARYKINQISGSCTIVSASY